MTPDVFLVLSKSVEPGTILGAELNENAAARLAAEKNGIVCAISKGNDGNVTVGYNTLYIVVIEKGKETRVIDTRTADPSRVNARPIVNRVDDTTEIWTFAYTPESAKSKALAALEIS